MLITGSALYIDQSAVKAAIHGRILILEGIEKAERNVLPVLNNLLENREMRLEDGRFLISAQRYDSLLKVCYMWILRCAILTFLTMFILNFSFILLLIFCFVFFF